MPLYRHSVLIHLVYSFELFLLVDCYILSNGAFHALSSFSPSYYDSCQNGYVMMSYISGMLSSARRVFPSHEACTSNNDELTSCSDTLQCGSTSRCRSALPFHIHRLCIRLLFHQSGSSWDEKLWQWRFCYC